MLKNIKIKGFRSCEDVEFDLEDVTVLIGRNASGKSNVLKAIETLAKVASEGLNQLFEEDFRFPHWSFEATISLPEAEYNYSAEISFKPRKFTEHLSLTQETQAKTVFSRNDEELTLQQNENKIRLGSQAAAMRVLASLFPSDDHIVQVLMPVLQFFTKVQYLVLDEPTEDSSGIHASIIFEKDFLDWAHEYQRSGRLNGQVPMHLTYLQHTDNARFDELNRLLSEPGLRLVEEVLVTPTEIEKFGPVQYVGFVCKTKHKFHPFHELSQGTRRLIRLATSMAFGGSLLLVEHPEDGIHEGLLPKIAGLFNSAFNESQVILTTHSDTLVNQFQPQNIRFVVMEDGKTEVLELNDQELKAASNYVKGGEDLTLAEFLHSVED